MGGNKIDSVAELDEADLPAMSRLDWDDLKGADIVPDPDDDDGPLVEGEIPGDLPEEDDDNAYQESDEALPDDSEAAIRRKLSSDDDTADG